LAELLTSSETAPVASAPSRLDYIDGLRALAALWVVLHHIAETSEPESALASGILRPILATLFFGQFPVMTFLALSGFCLYYPYARKAPMPAFDTPFSQYLRRRATRILPPYLVVIVAGIFLNMLPIFGFGRWHEISGNFGGWAVLSHLAMVHNLIPEHAAKIVYPAWSIGLEWQLYLLLPAMMWSFRRLGPVVSVLWTLALAIVLRGAYSHLPFYVGSALRSGPFAYLMVFGAGMAAAMLTAQRRRIAPAWALGTAAVASFAVIRCGSGNGLIHDVAAATATFALLQLTLDPAGAVTRFLSHPVLVRLGVFSYSLYLVHAPLVHLGWALARPLHLSGDATLVVLLVGCVPVIVLVSYGFHLAFERPFLRMGRPARSGERAVVLPSGATG
jgi:peptidoglycan/LPS O-acetylase OafA/YrhL